ncbi:hypothetical protein ACFQY7_53660 [Actinomadura luteofluorescens]|uniref:hypothetical protein n=1 Tax=Actinomadura luteofluorescens TaxID=46163 RepID=UPI00363F1414
MTTITSRTRSQRSAAATVSAATASARASRCGPAAADMRVLALARTFTGTTSDHRSGGVPCACAGVLV